MKKKQKAKKAKGLMSLPSSQASINKVANEVVKADEVIKKQRKAMTIGQTKLGVTMVLSKDDCIALGFDEETPTSEVITAVRARLDIPPRKRDKLEVEA